jgi:hypothetical protein
LHALHAISYLVALLTLAPLKGLQDALPLIKMGMVLKRQSPDLSRVVLSATACTCNHRVALTAVDLQEEIKELHDCMLQQEELINRYVPNFFGDHYRIARLLVR